MLPPDHFAIPAPQKYWPAVQKNNDVDLDSIRATVGNIAVKEEVGLLARHTLGNQDPEQVVQLPVPDQSKAFHARSSPSRAS